MSNKLLKDVNVGTEVCCLRKGWGVVTENDRNSSDTYPIKVSFGGDVQSYKECGRYVDSDVNPSLFLQEMALTPIPNPLPVDTKLLVWNKGFDDDKEKRHFSQFSPCKTKVICFDRGKSSFTAKDCERSTWEFWEVVD